MNKKEIADAYLDYIFYKEILENIIREYGIDIEAASKIYEEYREEMLDKISLM